MKKLMLIGLALFTLGACSDDDGGNGNVSENYFPAENNTSSNYAYQVNNQGETTSGNTTVTINGTTTIDGTSYQNLNNTIYLTGAAENIYFRKNGNNLYIKPQFDLFDMTYNFDELTLIADTNVGNTLSTATEVFEGEPTAIPTNEYNVTGTVVNSTSIKIESQYVNSLASRTVNDVTYDDVYHARIKYSIQVDLAVNAIFSGAETTINHQLIAPQEYGYSDIYFAKDVGIIETYYEYSFNDIELDTTFSVLGMDINLLELAPELSEFNGSLNIQGSADKL